MATITIDDAELRELIRKHAQRAAAEYLVNRTIPEYPHYFMEGHWIVTYDWLQREAEQRRSEIAYVQDQINRLRQPWWKRWKRWFRS